MRVNRQEWLKTQSQDFKQHIGYDLKKYQKQKITLEQLKDLDNRFIHNNSPEGGA
jgi:hypothetical protein